MTTLCIFGDSITQGSSDSQGGWAQRLKKYSENKSDKVHILGVDGATSSDLLQRFEVEASARRPDVIIFAIGINDSVYYLNKRAETSLSQFTENIKQLITLAKKFTNNIIFLGLTCVDERKTQPIPWNNWFYSNEKIKQYDLIIKETSQKEKIHYLELFSLLSTDDLVDGLHPSDRGHQKMFEKVETFLEEKKILP